MKYKVELTYFKETGKYYSEGSYETAEPSLYEIFNQVKQLIDTKKLPGLMEGHSDFYVLADVPNHPNRHPKLFIPGLIFKQQSVDLAQKESPKEIIERLKFKLESISCLCAEGPEASSALPLFDAIQKETQDIFEALQKIDF